MVFFPASLVCDSVETPKMKSAYELALERLDQQGIERPREDALSTEDRERIAEQRRKADARLAELEILHRKTMESIASPAKSETEQGNYLTERRRIEERCEREIRRIRGG